MPSRVGLVQQRATQVPWGAVARRLAVDVAEADDAVDEVAALDLLIAWACSVVHGADRARSDREQVWRSGRLNGRWPNGTLTDADVWAWLLVRDPEPWRGWGS